MTTTTAAARESALAADAAKLTSTTTATTKRTATKRTTARKPAATKTTTKKAPATKTVKASTGPTDRDSKRAAAAFAIKVSVAAFKAIPVVKGQVVIDGTSYPREVAWQGLRQTFGYVPPAAWDVKLLGVRDVGRPVSAKKAA